MRLRQRSQARILCDRYGREPALTMPACGLVVVLVGDLDGLDDVEISVIAAHGRKHRRDLGCERGTCAVLGSQVSPFDPQLPSIRSGTLNSCPMPSQSLRTVVAGVNSTISAHTPQTNPHERPCRLTLLRGKNLESFHRLGVRGRPIRAIQRCQACHFSVSPWQSWHHVIITNSGHAKSLRLSSA